MIKFYAGKADKDVAGRLRGALAELLKNDASGRKIIYIVPEQFEYETERAIYELLSDRGLLHKMNSVEITTFTALSADILSECGVNRPIADDIVKKVVMHKAVSACRGELASFAGVIDKPGFCEKIIATISSFKSIGLSSADVERGVGNIRDNDIAKNDPAVFKKLENVSLLYTAYDAIISQKGYLDSMDRIGMAAEIVRKTDRFVGADVFVDSFNDFTNHQLRFLCQIIPAARDLSFGFVTDYNNDSDVFGTANAQISKLIDKAKSEDIPTEIVCGDIAPRYAENSALSELPRLLFQNEKDSKASSKDIKDRCEIISAPEIFAELDFVCAKIKQLADSGMRYRDIAVLCTDIRACQRYIESAFNRYDIPIFLDMHESILGQPLINAVMSLLAALGSFSAETVLSCVKTRFFTKFDDEKGKRVSLSDYDINTFENYMYEWALSTEHLKKPFTFSDPYLNGRPDHDRITAEQIRKTVAEPLWKLSKELPHGKKTIDGAVLTETLYDYLKKTVNISDTLKAKCRDPLTDEQDSDRAALYQRLWDTLIRIFDALHDELKGVDVTLDEYYRLFRDICAGTTLASPPQMVDRVLIGDIDRTRVENVKAAFIVGASFDLFPTPAPQAGIFSEYETELLRDSVTHIGEDDQAEPCFRSAKDQFSLSLYRAYKAVCLPTEYLCLSYSVSDQSGETMHISSVSEEICKIYPDLEPKSASEFDNEFYCRSISAAKLRYATTVNSRSQENAELGEALRLNGCGEFVDRIKQLSDEQSAEFAGDHKLSAKTAAMLFPTKVGATDIEKLSMCKFKFFCEDGLGIRERTQRSFNDFKRGEAVHYVMERILKSYEADIPLFCTLTRGELFALSKKHLDEYCREQTNYSFFDDARSRFLFNNVAVSAADVLITMQTEFSARRYRPKFFELDLSSGEPKYIIDNDDLVTGVIPEAALYIDDENAANSAPLTDKTPVATDRRLLTAPLRIPLDKGRTLSVSGRIDRVDMFSENDVMYVRAVDYKSSVRSFDIDNAKHGINIQMLLYLSALLDANVSNRSLLLAPGAISYIPSGSSGAQDTPFKPYRLLAMKHRPSGLIILDSATNDEYKKYESSVIKRITEEDGMSAALENKSSLSDEEKKKCEKYETDLKTVEGLFDLKEGNNLSVSDFNDFLNEVKTNVGRNYSELLDGDISALPLEYSEAEIKLDRDKAKSKSNKKIPCKYCRFANICKNDGKKVIGVETEKAPDDKKSDGRKTRSKKKEAAK